MFLPNVNRNAPFKYLISYMSVSSLLNISIKFRNYNYQMPLTPRLAC